LNDQGTPADIASANFTEAEQFLTILDPDPGAVFTFQTTSPQIIHGSRAQLSKTFGRLLRLQQEGADVFVTINATDGQGRKAANIKRVRALFVDLDGAPLEPVLAWNKPPHVVVATSPGRYHCYWLIDGMPLEDFRGAQEALIDQFGADRGIKSVEHAMRLPGFLHRKREPRLVRIHQLNKHPAYPAALFEIKPQPVRQPHSDDGRTPEEILADVRMVAPYIGNPDLPWEEWNRRGMAFFCATDGSEEGFELFAEWSSKSLRACPRRY
jgi:hypothetical protein